MLLNSIILKLLKHVELDEFISNSSEMRRAASIQGNPKTLGFYFLPLLASSLLTDALPTRDLI